MNRGIFIKVGYIHMSIAEQNTARQEVLCEIAKKVQKKKAHSRQRTAMG